MPVLLPEEENTKKLVSDHFFYCVYIYLLKKWDISQHKHSLCVIWFQTYSSDCIQSNNYKHQTYQDSCSHDWCVLLFDLVTLSWRKIKHWSEYQARGKILQIICKVTAWSVVTEAGLKMYHGSKLPKSCQLISLKNWKLSWWIQFLARL